MKVSNLKDECAKCSVYISLTFGGICSFLGFCFAVVLMIAEMVNPIELPIIIYRCLWGSKMVSLFRISF